MTTAKSSPARVPGRRGFTLIELIVTLLLIGILLTIAVPQYLKTIELTKAGDAAATVNMIGAANRLFAVDHAGAYAYGAFPTCGSGVASCGAGTCPTSGPYSSACDLVYCRYLADQDWGSKPYCYWACPNAAGTCGVGYTGMASRMSGASAPYNTWTFFAGTTGRITSSGTSAPTPSF